MDGLLFRLGSDRFWYVQADGAFDSSSTVSTEVQKPISSKIMNL